MQLTLLFVFSDLSKQGHHVLAAAACGAAATFAHDCIMTPLDVVKQRLQLGFYSGILDCLKKVVRHEGPKALFVSFPTTLLMNIPYGGVMVATNESLKQIMNPSGERNVPAFFLSGAGAGALAALITNPLDVAKTRLQTQCMLLHPTSSLPPQKIAQQTVPATIQTAGVATAARNTIDKKSKIREVGRTKANAIGTKLNCETLRCAAQEVDGTVKSCKIVRFTGLLDTLQIILRNEGLLGFTRGLRPRLITHIPAVATTWTTYEVVKRLLLKYDTS